MSAEGRATREFTGRHMAIIMVAFFGTVISVNVTMAWYAETTWSGLVVSNSYVASQTFDTDTAVREREIARGWRVDTSYLDGRFRLHLRDAAGRPIEGAAVTVTIGHPVNANFDRTFTLSPAGGAYEGATALTAGRWEARVTIDKDGLAPWHRAVRFSVR
ncbi:cytochrome oxidase [Jiella endophytica]|uniref:Cytochrome oxidase n=1 Tax=Jiella endophytica TaxID=2558362 RepID=A0A4Y8RGR8_9HYPH|nr:FixH family protein [Jiella endophytica]TFF20650.1 cytochrome oxidase [Jiella endophytica]TFF26951.1 cytochrome oxidase [Jiella endophytica]